MDMATSPQTLLSRVGESKPNAQAAAASLLGYLDHPDVKAALQYATNRSKRPFTEYMLADVNPDLPLTEKSQPHGRIVLLQLAAGQPVESRKLRDALFDLRDALAQYSASFLPLPAGRKADEFHLVIPADGSSSYHALVDHRRHHGSEKLLGNERFLDADQFKELTKTMEGVREQAALALGRYTEHGGR